MAISTFPAAGGGIDSRPITYKGNPGDNTVNIPAGCYLVNEFQVATFPVKVGSKSLFSDSTFLDLETNATNINFSNNPVTSQVDPNGPSSLPYITASGFGNGLFLIGGENYLATSPDGITWTERTLPNAVGDEISGISYGAGLYVIVGEDGYAATSPDAITWTKRSVAGTGVDLNEVLFADNTFLVVGRNAFIATSSDGITWSGSINTVPNYTGTLLSVAYKGGTWLVTAFSGYIATSPDAANWTEQTFYNTEPIQGAAASSSLFVVAGDNEAGVPTIATSPDGVTWTQRFVPNHTRNLDFAFYDGAKFFVGGSGRYLASSADGENWDEVQNQGATTFSSGAYDGNLTYIFAGNNSEITLGQVPTEAQFLVLQATQLNDLT